MSASNKEKSPTWAKVIIIILISAAAFLIVGGFILLMLGKETVGAVFCIVLGAICLLFFGIGMFQLSHPGSKVATSLLIGLCVLFVGFLVAGVCSSLISTMVLSPFSDMEHYRQVWQDPISVTATVTDHRSYNDDGDTDYTSYITYSYDGTRYTDYEYENRDNKEDLTPIGTTVTVQISPKDPSRQISQLKSSSNIVPFVLFLLFLGLSSVYSLVQRQALSYAVLPDTQTICRDIKIKVRSRMARPFFLLCILGYGFLYLRYSVLFGIIPLMISLAAAAGWLFCMFTTIRDYRRADRGDYELRRDVLVDKKDFSDAESSSYILCYKSGERTWKSSTDFGTYNRAKIGDVTVAVYLPGKKKPIVHY